MSTTTIVRVDGMTCDHCVAAVRREVEQIAGVTAVDIDLASGEVNITSASPLSSDDIGVAVDDAGYELAG